MLVAPRLTPAVKLIIIVTVAFYILELTPAGGLLTSYLGLDPTLVMHGYVWQLLTYVVIHSPDPLHVTLNMVSLWFIGGYVESAWGSRRFLNFYLLCGFGGGVVATLMQLFIFHTQVLIIGASGAILGVLVALALLCPNDVMYFPPMKVTHFTLLLVAMDLARTFAGDNGTTASTAHLGGALTGYLYLRLSWRAAIWWKQSRRPAPGAGFRPTAAPVRKPSPRPVGRISRATGGGDEVTPFVPSVPRPVVTPSTADIENEILQKRADEILDKISREGMENLTREERDILHRQSQLLKAREGGGVVRLDERRSGPRRDEPRA